jgi:hypothetical protein
VRLLVNRWLTVELRLQRTVSPRYRAQKLDNVTRQAARMLACGRGPRTVRTAKRRVDISSSFLHTESETWIVRTIRGISSRKQTDERLRASATELERSNYELDKFAYVAFHARREPGHGG